MKNIFTYIIVVLIVVVVSALVIFLPKSSPRDTDSLGKVNVVASFYPLAYLAKTIGGEFVQVKNLTPNGAEPHDFEPTVRDIAHLGSADVFLYNGGSFEPWIADWSAGEFDRPRHVVDMITRLKEDQNTTLIVDDGVVDPHAWLDPLLYARQAEIIRDVFVQADPVHEVEYRAYAENLINSLKLLDQEFRSGLSACTINNVIVSHDAFSYPARSYGFELINIAGMSPDEEPSPQTLAEIIEKARSYGIRHVFFETTVSPRLANTIAREIGAGTLVLHTLENLSTDEVQSGQDYLTIMRQNLANLRIARACN